MGMAHFVHGSVRPGIRSRLRPNGLVWVFWADGLPLLSQCPVPVLAFDDILLVREPSLEVTLVPNPKHLTSLEERDAVLAEGDGYVILLEISGGTQCLSPILMAPSINGNGDVFSQ